MINRKRLIELTREFIRINSENPPGNEYRIALRVKKILEDLGLKTKTYEFTKNRPNVIGILKGESKKSLLLLPHLDTVPAGKNWKFPPFKAKMYKRRIYGRGASDCKGNLAIGLEALRSLIEDRIRLNYNLVFAATSDEETGSGFGLIPLLEKKIIRADYALILDGESFDIVISQKGLIHFRICVFGKKAHGAYPDRGINAIEISSKIIQKLKDYSFKFKPHPLLKPPTINIGTIRGGDKVNVVADWCEFEVDLRYLPGMKKDEILRDLREIIKKDSKKFRIEIQAIQEPYEIEKDNLLVESLFKAVKKIKGRAKFKGSEGATQIVFFKGKIPAVAFGIGAIRCAHRTDEYVNIDDLYKGALVLEEFIKEFNGRVRL
jgi:acetylornithine deacetylase/succinyl-diaminopimelate desuccinylase family protein